MGKTTCLTRAVSVFLQRGDSASYYDFQGSAAADVVQELRRAIRKYSKMIETGKSEHVLIALDNIYVEDESESEAISCLIERMMKRRLSLALSIVPECEMLAEMIPATICFWSCDLRLPRPDVEARAGEFDLYANGVPCMVDAIHKAYANGASAIASDPSFQEPYISMVLSSVRNGMMGEEKQLRIAMLLLGFGTKDELEQVLSVVDDDLWLSIVRDAPFLGADAVHGTFRCVGSHTLDCLHLAYSALCTLTRDWPELTGRVARLLIGRGEYSKGALVASMCSDPEERHAMLLENGPQMINAGELAVVVDALDECRELGRTELKGYNETSCVLAALGERGFAKTWHACPSLGNDLSGQYAALAWWCRELHKGMNLGEETPASSLRLGMGDAVVDALAAHGATLNHIASGRPDLAYEGLLDNASRLRERSVASALAQMDYMLCSLLTGIAPSALDRETMDDHLSFLEQSGLTMLVVAYDAVMAVCSLLAGRTAPRDSLETHIHRVERRGDVLSRALLLMAASVSDMRVGALTRGHVRLQQAIRAFTGVGCQTLSKVATLLDLALRAELGERILRPEIQACAGATKHLDQVVTILCAALSTTGATRTVGSGRWGALDCPRDVMWLVNVLMNDFGSVSERFLLVMPTAWRDSAMHAVVQVDAYLEDAGGQDASAGDKKQRRPRNSDDKRGRAGEKPVHMSMLGGFEVLVGGLPVSSGRLERRRAKALLALLAAVPGHRAKRFVIMESVWPTHDYESANKCLYSSTSVLRKEIGCLLDDQPLVTTNKAEGTISLDPLVFDCDIDEFEAAAHDLLDIEGDDRQLVTMCRKVEELYRGDLFVPPTDGVGVVETRARELRALFADAMIAGASAAGRLGMKSLACRFAKKAHNADNMREDAMRVLAIALCAAGRHTEAERCYEQFVGRVVDVTKRPPSRQLRKVVEELLNGKLQKRDARHQKGRLVGAGHASVPVDGTTSEQMSFSFEPEPLPNSEVADG